MEILSITSVVETLSLINATDGIVLGQWIQATPEPDALFTETSYSGVSTLEDILYGLIEETIPISIYGITQQKVLDVLSRLQSVVNNINNFWLDNKTYPYYLQAKTEPEVDSRFAVLHYAELKDLPNVFGADFNTGVELEQYANGYGLINMTLQVRRGMWMDTTLDKPNIITFNTTDRIAADPGPDQEMGGVNIPDRVIVAVSEGIAVSMDSETIMKTVNYGYTWDIVLTAVAGYISHSISKEADGTLWSYHYSNTTENGIIYRSLDDGDSWSLRYTGACGLPKRANNGNLYAVHYSGYGTYRKLVIRMSSNEGTSWSTVASAKNIIVHQFAEIRLAIDEKDYLYLYEAPTASHATYLDTIYISKDYGVTWDELLDESGWLHLFNSGARLAFNKSEALYSTDGDNWRAFPHNIKDIGIPYDIDYLYNNLYMYRYWQYGSYETGITLELKEDGTTTIVSQRYEGILPIGGNVGVGIYRLTPFIDDNSPRLYSDTTKETVAAPATTNIVMPYILFYDASAGTYTDYSIDYDTTYPHTISPATVDNGDIIYFGMPDDPHYYISSFSLEVNTALLFDDGDNKVQTRKNAAWVDINPTFASTLVKEGQKIVAAYPFSGSVYDDDTLNLAGYNGVWLRIKVTVDAAQTLSNGGPLQIASPPMAGNKDHVTIPALGGDMPPLIELSIKTIDNNPSFMEETLVALTSHLNGPFPIYAYRGLNYEGFASKHIAGATYSMAAPGYSIGGPATGKYGHDFVYGVGITYTTASFDFNMQMGSGKSMEGEYNVYAFAAQHTAPIDENAVFTLSQGGETLLKASYLLSDGILPYYIGTIYVGDTKEANFTMNLSLAGEEISIPAVCFVPVSKGLYTFNLSNRSVLSSFTTKGEAVFLDGGTLISGDGLFTVPQNEATDVHIISWYTPLVIEGKYVRRYLSLRSS